MKYTIAFNTLPFEPEKRQVIYVENQFDESINAIIKSHYEQIKWNFKRANLDFVYLPMFFNDEEIKEKILYYAPYLTSDIIEKTELRSSYLLGYMSHLENKEKIEPSFLFDPKKDDDEWIFQGQTINIDNDGTAEILQWLEDTISDIDEEISLEQPKRYIRYKRTDDSALSQEDEDIDLETTQVEYSSTPNIGDRFKRWLKHSASDIVKEEDNATGSSALSSQATLDDIHGDDIRETFKSMEKNIERLRFLGVPLDAIYEFVRKYETISRLLITDDLRIILLDYNKEVTMPALYKAVYLLFIYYRKDGIILQELENYHNDLVDLYKKTKMIDKLNPRQIQSINKLESSWDDDGSIHTVLSRIKTAFRNVVHEHLARHYYILGRPGEPYKISLDPKLIEWEDEYE